MGVVRSLWSQGGLRASVAAGALLATGAAWAQTTPAPAPAPGQEFYVPLPQGNPQAQNTFGEPRTTLRAEPAAAPPIVGGNFFDLTSLGKPLGAALAQDGIYIRGSETLDLFGNVAGRETGNIIGHMAILGTDLDLTRLAGLPFPGVIHFTVVDRAGGYEAKDTGEYVVEPGTYGPIRQDAIRLTELSFDTSLLNDHLRILAGRVQYNIDFARSELYSQFIGYETSNITAVYFNNGENVFSTSVWGARFTFKPTLTTYIRTGVYEEEPFDKFRNHQGWPGQDWGFNEATGAFIPWEIGYKTNFQQDPFPRGFDVGGFWDTTTFADPLYNSAGLPIVLSGGKPLIEKDRTGIWVQAQQMVYRPDMKSTRGATIFGAAMFDTSGAEVIKQDWEVGLVDKGPFASRPNDSIGLLAVYYQFDQRVAEAINDQIIKQGGLYHTTRDSFVYEANYGFQFAPGFQLKPFVQFFEHPVQFSITPVKEVTHAWVLGGQFSLILNDAFGLPAFVRTN